MRRKLHDGREDGLEPVVSVNPDEIESFGDLLEAMGRTSFGGRRLGEGFEVMKEMLLDLDCYVVATFSGAMTIAKMGKIISRMIDLGMIQAVVSTGALVAHGFSESLGCSHYKVNPNVSDTELFVKGYNRIYDTLELEANLNSVEKAVAEILGRIPEGTVLHSEMLTHELGRTLAENYSDDGILKSAFIKKVPVYIPAFTDSELGLDLSTWAMRAGLKAKYSNHGTDIIGPTIEECTEFVPSFNPFLDLNSYTRNIMNANTLGIFTIGGGVPRNWAQQVGPYMDIANIRTGSRFNPPRFKYGVRICPEPDYWGGLSGCTYSEGISWGKFISPKEGGRFAEVLSDATVVLPLLVKGLLEIMENKPKIVRMKKVVTERDREPATLNE